MFFLQTGTYEELLENGNDFAEFLRTYHTQNDNKNDELHDANEDRNQKIINHETEGNTVIMLMLYPSYFEKKNYFFS